MLYRLLAGVFAIGVAAVAMTSSAAQPFTEGAAANAIRDAYALAARIRSYHRWTSLTPLPASYCPTMRQGEAVLAEVARLSSRAWGEADVHGCVASPGWVEFDPTRT
jgi:hypothetical protein